MLERIRFVKLNRKMRKEINATKRRKGYKANRRAKER